MTGTSYQSCQTYQPSCRTSRLITLPFARCQAPCPTTAAEGQVLAAETTTHLWLAPPSATQSLSRGETFRGGIRQLGEELKIPDSAGDIRISTAHAVKSHPPGESRTVDALQCSAILDQSLLVQTVISLPLRVLTLAQLHVVDLTPAPSREVQASSLRSA